MIALVVSSDAPTAFSEEAAPAAAASSPAPSMVGGISFEISGKAIPKLAMRLIRARCHNLTRSCPPIPPPVVMVVAGDGWEGRVRAETKREEELTGCRYRVELDRVPSPPNFFLVKI